jgi:hypothetical protein
LTFQNRPVFLRSLSVFKTQTLVSQKTFRKGFANV